MKNEIYCCNFCGRSSQEARKMIGSPNGECFICDSCIKYCSNLLNHDQIENTKKELQKLQNEIIEDTHTALAKIYMIVAKDEQIHEESIKILNRLKINLGKPEMIERAKEQVEIVIDMLTDNKK